NYRRCFDASVNRALRRSGAFSRLWDEAADGAAPAAVDGGMARKLAVLELRSMGRELEDAMEWLKALEKEVGGGS
ncbi:hypothetical protein V6O07_16580, partial [Arthrospira platensis SPKY2]